jgi:NAD(P)-dependent dehydrogenase (short-subunit alcohol dehydrogenase family)
MGNDYFLRNRETIATITGGTQGLGLAIAKRLAREGARGIILGGRSPDKGEEAAASGNSMGTECFFVKADVSVPAGAGNAHQERRKRLCRQADSVQWDPDRLDGYSWRERNAATFYISTRKPFIDFC